MPNILALDTATEACSVALLLNGGSSNETIDSIFEICPQQHSQKVLSFIDSLLQRNEIQLKELDLIAYGCGPGSFTGVRIAASTVQGLAYGADLPVAQVSTLAAMAWQNFKENKVSQSLALTDARMSEVYKGYYECRDDGITQLQKEEVLPPELVSELISELSVEQFVGTGFEAYQQELGIKKLHNSPKLQYPSAKYMLDLARQQFNAKELVTAEQIAPTYLRDKVTWKKLPGKE